MNIHKYYQKILTLLFLNDEDPFERELLNIEVEKNIDRGVVDLFLEWKHNHRTFSEIIEVQLTPKKKTLQDKIKLYSKKSDLFSICLPSKTLKSALKVFAKMKADLPSIHLVYLMHEDNITKNQRKIVDDKSMVVTAFSPFILMKCKDGSIECIEKFVNDYKKLFFEALLPSYLKR